MESETPMGSTFLSLHYHIVFSTKERRPLIRAEWRPRLHSYFGGIIRGMKGVAEIVGGMEDHVHLLASLRPVHCVADMMRDLKKDSTNWLKENLDRSFGWPGRIRCVYGESIRYQRRAEIHRESGSASLQAF